MPALLLLLGAWAQANEGTPPSAAQNSAPQIASPQTIAAEKESKSGTLNVEPLTSTPQPSSPEITQPVAEAPAEEHQKAASTESTAATKLSHEPAQEAAPAAMKDTGTVDEAEKPSATQHSNETTSTGSHKPQANGHEGDSPTVADEKSKENEPPQNAEAKASHGDSTSQTENGHTSPSQGSHEAQTGAEAHATPKAHAEAASPGHGETAKTAHGASAGAHEEKAEVPAEIMTMQATELFKYADKAYEDGRYDMALIGYRQLLSYKIPKTEIRKALLSFGRTLKKKGELTKAVAVYERLIKDFPAEQDTPEIYLELGRCQRALGAYKTAINRFYSVLNSTIKLTEDGAAKYRQLAKTAQFEIAETYFIAGDYKEAMRFYSRLRLLDLNPVDRARAHFKAAYSQQLAGDHLGSITQLRSFIELNPDDENVPEARYLVAMSLRALGRSQDALFEALELLRTERTRTAQDPKRWAYWQRKTGNQIANEFYNQGDTNSALMIYLSLVELSSEASWRAPMLYQIALCQERQGRKDKAIENYKSILDIAAAQKGDDPRKADFAELARMATWRLSQIEWVHNAEQRLNTLLPNIDSEGSQPPPPEKK